MGGEEDVTEEGVLDSGERHDECFLKPLVGIAAPFKGVVVAPAIDVNRPSISATIRRSDPREIHPRCLRHRSRREIKNRKNGITTA